MAKAVAEDFNRDFLEKLYIRDAEGGLPSRLQQVMSNAEKERLKDNGRLLQEKVTTALELLAKFNNVLPLIENEEVKQNSLTLAEAAKEEFVKFAVQDYIVNPDPEIGDQFLVIALMFAEEENCFDLENFLQNFDQELVPQAKKEACENRFNSIHADFQNNHNQR